MQIITIVLGIILMLLLTSFIPTLSLKTSEMSALEGSYATVYYEKEKAAAQAVLGQLDKQSLSIAARFGFKEPVHLTIYIYDNQKTFLTKKYGYLTLFMNLDWYIGDNKGTSVMLTSPAHPGPAHTYEEIVNQVCVHEAIHSYNSVVNKGMPLWLNEGLATYMTGQTPRGFNPSKVPAIDDMHTSNPIAFANMGGYTFAYLYIEYLDKTYGWDNVVTLAKTSDYSKAFGKTERELYSGWRNYLDNRKQTESSL